MKKTSFLFALILCLIGGMPSVFANWEYPLTSKQIMITETGILLNINGQVMTTESISYLGNGLYSMSESYYGSCRRCGWALDQNGKCPNQNCNGYGPPDR